MRRSRSAALILTALGAMAFAVPAGASQPGDTEHGVNRAKLIAKAERIVETRNGIDVLKVNKCRPRKRKGRLDFSTWICTWRAAGFYSGEVQYSCAGRAVYKRKTKTWIVDRCENTRQPVAPLLDTPNPPPTFGFNDNWLFQPARVLNLAEEAGTQVVRLSLPWSGVEYERGTFGWGGTDLFYQQLLDRGMRPLWVLMSAPCYAQRDPAACNDSHPAPAYYDDFARFAVMVAQHYPESFGIEVWNEPNYPTYWGGPPEPDEYAQMFKTVADALHTQTPGIPVVTAGLSPHSDGDESGSMGFHEFLNELYARGAAQKADAIGIHPYPGVGPSEDYMTDVRIYLGKVENVMDRNGDGSKPLWATEFGVSTAGDKAFSPDAAGQAIGQLLQMFQRIRGIDVAIVHRMIEDPSLPGREAGFGVLNRDLTPKPAFCELASVRGILIPDVC